jgi:hypothetical protein
MLAMLRFPRRLPFSISGSGRKLNFFAEDVSLKQESKAKTQTPEQAGE